MIIELTGIPGVGKTAVFNELRILSKSNTRYIFPLKEKILKQYNLSVVANGIIGIVVYEVILYITVIKKIKQYRTLLKLCIRKTKESSNSIFNKVNILRNIFKKIGIFTIIRDDKENNVYFIDEGLIHIPFNIFVDGSKKVYTPEEYNDIFELINKPDVVIIFDADDAILRDRVISRGDKSHRRIVFNDTSKFDQFLNQSRAVVEWLKINLKEKTEVININNDGIVSISDISEEILKKINEIECTPSRKN